MKQLMALSALLFTVAWLFMAQPNSPDDKHAQLVFSGEVLSIGIEPGANSDFPFQLLKYRVTGVCEGEFTEKEILVYHLVGPEGIPKLKVGDTVCVRVARSFWADADAVKEPKVSIHLETDFLAFDIIKRCQCSNQ